MLDLVRRTGKEFGISIMMASHLLGEIERVCEYLVVIDGGHLLRQGPLGDFTAAMGVLAVEVEGEAAILAGTLRERGLRTEVEGRMVLVALEGDERAFDLIRDSCVDLGFGLVRLEPRRQNLEDLFRPTEKGAAHAAS